MRFLTIVVHKVRSLLAGDRLDAEAREELAQHFERQVQMHLRSGLTPVEARRAAAVDLGGFAQLSEACRDARGLAWWDSLRADLRYGLRQMRRRPGFAAAAILTLAVGVGATSAVFAVVDAVLLRPLPYPGSERMYALYEINNRSTVGRTSATPLNFQDWRDEAASFAGMAAYAGTGFTLTGRGEPAFVLGQLVTPNLLDVLAVQPMLGRAFLPHETEAGRNRVVILTHGLWQRHFGGDPSIVGSTSSINGMPYEIVGIMPPGFRFPSARYQLLTPLVMQGSVPDGPPINRNARYLRVVGRLQPDVSEAAAREELDVIGRRLAEAYAETNENVTIGMTNLASDTVDDARADLVVVLTAVGVVLLIACVNVAGLAIARGSARSRELGVRVAIGASRGRLVRQLATEGLLLFATGGVAGLLLAAWGVETLVRYLPESIPRLDEIAFDWRVFTFGVTATLALGLFFSVLPALSIVRRGAAGAFAGGRGAVGPGVSTARLRSGLIVVQIAAALMLLTGAALAVRSLDRVRRVDMGFERAGAMTFSFVMRDQRFPAGDDMRRFVDRVWETLSAEPGIQAAGVTTALPLSDQNIENGFTVDGAPVEPSENRPIAGLRGVAGHYRSAIGARLLRGRDLLPTDTRESQPVVVVTDDFVERYVKAADPLGVRVKMGGPRSEDPWRTIVGVLAAIRHSAPDASPRPEVWLPFAQMDDDFLTTWGRGVYVAARTSMEPHAAIPSLKSGMRALEPDLPLIDMLSLEELSGRSTSERRLETTLLAGFASIALVLAAIGLFGVLAFYVAQHVQEFGVRLALGATPAGLLRLVMARGAVLLVLGVAIGLPAALALGQGMSTLLYGVEPTDPLALTTAALTLAAVTLAACVLPARRAMKTDPLVALRVD